MMLSQMFKSMYHSLRFLTGVACLLSMPGILSQPNVAQAQSLPGWTLVWQDEFDGPNIDLSKWEHEVNASGGGNNELQYYTARSANSFIQDGALVIQALEENYTGREGTRDYTSARLRTLNKGDWTYGRFEARMKLPHGRGLWPAFWMLPSDWVYGGWAASGEIDIMELVGHQPNVLHGTIHYHGEWPDNWGSGASWTLSSGDFSDDFHVFALEWEAGEMRWYVDGIHYSTKTSWDTLSGAPFPAPFDQRFHALLNVAVGGNWPGNPDGTTVFPQRMTVDYFRVYAPTNTPPPTGTNVLINPGFETSTLGPWVGYSIGGANNLGTYVQSTSDTYYNGGNAGGDNVLTHSGTYVGKMYGDFTGGENHNGCYQDIPAVPGSFWNADGWALTHAQDLMQPVNTSWIEVSFRNASDTILALYRSEVLDSGNISVSSWMHLPVTNEVDLSSSLVTNTTSILTAPAGTTKARYQLVFRQRANDNGAMYYDDLNLVLRPVAEPVSLKASLVGTDIQISFETQAGVSYQVAYKANLTDPSWTPIETIAGDGTIETVFYPANTPTRFYTVQIP